MNDLATFIVGALINLAITLVIVRWIYYPLSQEKQYVFTFMAFNTMIYAVMALLANTELSVGVGFGLFAIFSVLRYRTEEVPIREMTYLFIVIALPVINAILMGKNSMLMLGAVNGVIVAIIFVLEQEWGFQFATSKKITYERVDLITPDKYPALLADLRQRTGLPITRIDVGKIDFLHDTAELKIFYAAARPGAQRAQMRELAPRDRAEAAQ